MLLCVQRFCSASVPLPFRFRFIDRVQSQQICAPVEPAGDWGVSGLMRHKLGLSINRIAFLPLLSIAACTSYMPYTDRIVDRYSLGSHDRSLLQYFVSDEFCLRRDTTDETAHITAGGTIRFFRGRRVEELRVPRHTPGATVGSSEGGLAISFVPGDNRSVLVFAPDGDSGWEDASEGERHGRFAAPPSGAKTPGGGDRYFLQGDATRTIRYDGKSWTVHYDRRPYLLIRGRDVEDHQTRVQTLPGRTVGR